MNTRQNATAQTFLRVQGFLETRLPELGQSAPPKVLAKITTSKTRLDQAVTDLGGKQAVQAGGSFGQSTEDQRQARRSLNEELQDVIRTADAIADETDNPGLMDRFRMPDGSGDEELKSRALGMAAAIRELSLNDEFEAHGHSADTAAEIEELVEDLDDSEGAQGTALGTQAGATASIPEVLTKGKAAMKTLNAIFHRLYAKQPGPLAAWRTASHIERPARRRNAEAPTPTPAPATPSPPAPPTP